jgi:GNAT superfamily N-acetyltransferase
MNLDSLLTRATPADFPVLVTLIREFCAIDGHDFDEGRLRASLPPLLVDDAFGVVWLLGDPVDGYAVVTWGYSLESGGREALIDEIYLRSRNQGLGTKVLGAIIEDCRARGCKIAFLETEARNARVRKLYGRLGFVEDDSVWMSLPL